MAPYGREKPEVILWGLKSQGLFLLRELSRAGFDVHGIDSRKTPAFHSRYGSKYLAVSPEELSSILLGFHKRFGPGLRCYISSGVLLDWVIEYMPELYVMFAVYPRPLSAVIPLSRKLDTCLLGEEFGIACPHIFTLAQANLALEFLSTGEKIIAKWNREFTGMGNLPKFKTLVIAAPHELEILGESLSEEEREHLVFQQFIEGGPAHSISYQGYYVEGLCVARLVAQQLRQFPRGITSYLKEYNGPGADAVIEEADQLFSGMHCTGFCEAEFKVDSSFAVPYLLEINRCTPSSGAGGCAGDTVYESYHDLQNARVCPYPGLSVAIHREPLWLAPIRDFLLQA